MLRHGLLGHSRMEPTLSNAEPDSKVHTSLYDARQSPQSAPNHPPQPFPQFQPIAHPQMLQNLANSAAPHADTPVAPISEQTSGEDGVSLASADSDTETYVCEDQQLEELPPSVVDAVLARQLRKLSLKSNKLSSLPLALRAMTSLYYLNLSHNRFTRVPEVVLELKGLEILDLSHNSIVNLPSALSNLPQLMGLSLVGNKIEILPPVIADLSKIVILELDDNPISVPGALQTLTDGDDDTWLAQIREVIKRNRPVLDNALLQQYHQLYAQHQQIHQRRPMPERSRSASESGTNLRAAKRMGFVMSRSATDQLYVANLHARGLSHDAHMLDAVTQPPAQQNKPEAEPMSALTSLPGAEGDLPTPRSPVSALSPHASPWTSPRACMDGAVEPTGGNSGRLGTLAEEHDVELTSPTGKESLDPIGQPPLRERNMSPPKSTSPNVCPPQQHIHHQSGSNSSAGHGSNTSQSSMEGATAGGGALQWTLSVKEDVPAPSSSVTVTASQFKESYHQKSLRSDSPRIDASALREGLKIDTQPRVLQRNASVGSNPLLGSSLLTPGALSATTQLHSAPNSLTKSDPNSPREVPVENISYALHEFGAALNSVAFAFGPALKSLFMDAQARMAGEQWTAALTAFGKLLEKLTNPPVFHEVVAQLSRRQQRHLASTIVLTFPELEAAWRRIQQSYLPLNVNSIQSHTNDDQLHSQLGIAIKQAQSVLALLNGVVAKAAIVAANDKSQPGASVAMRVSDLSSVCIRCNNSARDLRTLLDQLAVVQTRTRKLSERRRFWDEVNGFLKAVIATLSAVKSALPEMLLLSSPTVRTEVADLTRIAKEIPPLLEQSSYRLLLDQWGGGVDNGESYTASAAPMSAAPMSAVPQSAIPTPSVGISSLSGTSSAYSGPMATGSPTPGMLEGHHTGFNSQSVLSLAPTPLTATLGAAAQALVSPNERQERPSEGYIQFGLRAQQQHQLQHQLQQQIQQIHPFQS